jgi:hypothetical protein
MSTLAFLDTSASSLQPIQIDRIDLLLGLAWFGRLTTSQVQRLWYPHRRVERAGIQLNRLHAQGLVDRMLFGKEEGGHWRRTGYIWWLTRQGEKEIQDDADFPRNYLPARKTHRLDHAIAVSEAIVQMIVIARNAHLSGVKFEREVCLSEELDQPIADANIVLRLGGEPTPPNIVPWTQERRMPNEQSYRFALEIDRATDKLSKIAAKAHAYKYAREHWRRGTFPTPVWVAPTARRRDSILEAWRDAWPAGHWLMTTDAGLQFDQWLSYDNGHINEQRLLEAVAGQQSE